MARNWESASSQASDAREKARLAIAGEQQANAGRLAAEATGLASTQPDLAALLSLESLRSADSQTAWASVETALSQPVELSRVLYAPASQPQVNAVAVSPGGKLLAAATESGQVQIWNSASGQPEGKPFPRAQFLVPPCNDVAFSPDGKLLATIGADVQLGTWPPTPRSAAR